MADRKFMLNILLYFVNLIIAFESYTSFLICWFVFVFILFLFFIYLSNFLFCCSFFCFFGEQNIV